MKSWQVLTAFLVVVGLPPFLITLALCGQTNSIRLQPRSERITELSRQLRWQDEPGRQQYVAVKDGVTQRLLGEVDGLVTESLQPSTATPDRVKVELDRLFGGNGKAEATNNVAFSANFFNGHFLIVGVEVSRGGLAIDEDAISIRAYKEEGGKFVFVADTEDLHSANARNPDLAELHAKPLNAPVAGEFWFVAYANVPPQSPPTVAMRLYAFDGEKFRTIWAPDDILSASVDKSIDVTESGFTVNRLFDPSGHAPHSPTVAVHEQFALSVNGPQKIKEWQSDVQ